MHTGNWVFSSGTISFSEIYDLYEKYFHGKLLYIVVDCCYSGQWVLRLAEYLTSQGIGACGHRTRQRGILIKVMAACLPRETAYDGVFSNKGVCLNDKDHRIQFLNSTIKPGQTPCALDTTKICCFNSPQGECKWLLIPEGTDWSWSQLVDSIQRRNIINRIYLIRGKVKGKQAWHYVLVKSHLLKKIEDQTASGTVNVADYGHVLYSGWGTDPPESTKNKLVNFAPC